MTCLLRAPQVTVHNVSEASRAGCASGLTGGGLERREVGRVLLSGDLADVTGKVGRSVLVVELVDRDVERRCSFGEASMLRIKLERRSFVALCLRKGSSVNKTGREK